MIEIEIYVVLWVSYPCLNKHEILRITKLPSKSNAIFLLQFILEGDEILEWNEQSLVDCTEKEVNEIMTVDDSMDIHIRLSRTW